ncbi:MAG TPA: GNAT family N-acetyltransferase, partial [Candidatus Faecivivens stercoripullorum]|nr:GNAT family N-acetyltransferase [Candidatus Faecivivens stercoripullorum]
SLMFMPGMAPPYPPSQFSSYRRAIGSMLVDFGVLEKFRRRGIGTILMDTAEQIVSETGDTVYLEVGLHNGYGAAQRMYVKRGYIPDGQGVLYKGEVCLPYHPCRNDDDLTLRFSKQLKQGR